MPKGSNCPPPVQSVTVVLDKNTINQLWKLSFLSHELLHQFHQSAGLTFTYWADHY